MSYWLFKSEPDTFSIDDLYNKPHRREHWDGVRNYQVRNLLRDQIQPPDLAFFYHSSCATPGIVGTMKIIKSGYPDLSAQDPKSSYYDPKASPENPRWYMVDVQFLEKFDHIITLDQIKKHTLLSTMRVAERGNRLSITEVSKKHWDIILELAHS